MSELKIKTSDRKLLTVVVYKTQTETKYYMLITEDSVDTILNSSKRKPLLPNNFEIVDIGMGESYIEKYKKIYKIK